MAERVRTTAAVCAVGSVLGTAFMLVGPLLCEPQVVVAGSRPAGGRPCPVGVVRIRPRKASDRPVIAQLPFAVGSDPRSILGPDSLRLVDVNDSDNHPRVFIEDMRSGSRDDIVGASASGPAWSPNGRFIACAAYQVQDQASELAVVDRRTRRRVINDTGTSADEYRWSPDSRWIAVEGVEKGTNHVVLSVYDLARGRRHRLATTNAFGSFGLSWSPDSRLLAFTKPTTVDEDETVLAADLWVARASDWLPCPTRTTQTEIESQPEWISDTAVLVTSTPSSSPHTPGRQLVFELQR